MVPVNRVRGKYDIKGEYLLYVGTLEPRKNVVRLLQAFHKLKREGHTDYKLVITGAKGWLYQNIFSLISKLELHHQVIFTGWVPEEELPILMSGAQVLVYPSLYEGFGLPPLQAMACGTPVITSNISSMPEVVGDAAILIDPYNIDEIATAIHQVLSDGDLRQRMSQMGIERAKLFSLEKEARQTIEIFNSFGNDD
jgi:glycosyltransferase involved in cell wall biosynthesis